jgi:trehalose-6-phosphate synthase
MPAAEKKRRARALKSSIEKEDLSNWLYCLLDDASRLT